MKEIEKNPDDPYFYFQVGQSYNSIEDYENAYLYYKKAFELPIDPRQPWLPVIAQAYLHAMNVTERAEEAVAFFVPRYDQFADDASFLCTLGASYLRLNQPMKAMMEFVKAIQCPNVREEGVNTYLPYYNIGLINEMLGDLSSAVSFYRRAAAFGYPLAIDRLNALGVSTS